MIITVSRLIPHRDSSSLKTDLVLARPRVLILCTRSFESPSKVLIKHPIHSKTHMLSLLRKPCGGYAKCEYSWTINHCFYTVKTFLTKDWYLQPSPGLWISAEYRNLPGRLGLLWEWFPIFLLVVNNKTFLSTTPWFYFSDSLPYVQWYLFQLKKRSWGLPCSQHGEGMATGNRIINMINILSWRNFQVGGRFRERFLIVPTA